MIRRERRISEGKGFTPAQVPVIKRNNVQSKGYLLFCYDFVVTLDWLCTVNPKWCGWLLTTVTKNQCFSTELDIVYKYINTFYPYCPESPLTPFIYSFPSLFSLAPSPRSFPSLLPLAPSPRYFRSLLPLTLLKTIQYLKYRLQYIFSLAECLYNKVFFNRSSCNADKATTTRRGSWSHWGCCLGFVGKI
jgi:hypothetical protein